MICPKTFQEGRDLKHYRLTKRVSNWSGKFNIVQNVGAY